MDKRSLMKEMMHVLAGIEDAEVLDESKWSFSKDTPNFQLWKLGGDCCIGHIWTRPDRRDRRC